jgi:Na+-translocating ferredoxin:NAD+ oxidoreductase RnfG subunit
VPAAAPASGHHQAGSSLIRGRARFGDRARSRETPGLGDKIYKDPKFVAEFHGLAVEPAIKLIKGHGEAANEVDAITGATISSKAVVRIVNQAARFGRAGPRR